MNEPSLERWAERLTVTARGLPYPPTPNLAAGPGARLAAKPARPAFGRWQWALAALALLLLALLAVPPVRAAVVQFIQIGVVRILVGPATATPAPAAAPSGTPGTATPVAPTPASSLLEALAGETTLAQAAVGAGFPIKLPAYPADLGLPDRVFLQTDGAPMVVLAWLDPARPGQARVALFEIAPGNIGLEKSEFIKGVPPELQNTTVHGQPAAWTTGPYLLVIKNGDYVFERVIEGHALIWFEQGRTYRLELGSGASMAEAVRIAESLR